MQVVMNEVDLTRIEDALGRRLPQVFRRVMMSFPQELIDDAVVTDADGNEYADCLMISPNVEAILAGIDHYRSEPGWPKHFLVVGENGCGEVYSVDISREECPVFESGPHNDAGASAPTEEGYFQQVSADLESWVATLALLARQRAAGINPMDQFR